MFRLLFHSVWQSLRTVLESEQQFEAAAAMVLHTWNQHLESHVHVHAIVPGGGPSLKNSNRWRKATPPPHERPDRDWLVDADNLRHEFRQRFLSGLRRLHAKGKLKLEGDWSHLKDAATFETFLAPLEAKSWVTYIEPPPETSRPEDVVKYLARYLTGGPISDRRLVAYDGRSVTFAARTGTTHGGSAQTEEVTLSGKEFVRRWSLHILPTGFTKSRRFGGWSSRHRDQYVERCRSLVARDADVAANKEPHADLDHETESTDHTGQCCPTCGEELERVEYVRRTSWRDIFRSDARPAWYRSQEPDG